MSSELIKTKYKSTCDIYGSTEERTLYCKHNNSSNLVTFYDEDGSILFIVEDTMNNNLFDAITRLYLPHKGIEDGVEVMTNDDRKKCGIKSY